MRAVVPQRDKVWAVYMKDDSRAYEFRAATPEERAMWVEAVKARMGS
jgi:hypothetical protein